VLRVVEARLKDTPAAVKIRFDNDRTRPDIDIPGDIAKARAVRRLVGNDFPLAFDANNGYSVGGAIRVGRVLEELGYWWFEEPVQHYHVKAMGEVAKGSTSRSPPANRPTRWPDWRI
jgi:L-alanine-DL-glutamate epimerase-like enolase superfamily enzyme